MDWRSKVGPNENRFITDGAMGIELIPSAYVYDRLPTDGGPYPVGRLQAPFGFPYMLVAGVAPMFGIAASTTLAHKAGVTELVFTSHSARGDTVITGDFAADGRLNRIDSARGVPGSMSHEIVAFNNYKFGSAAAPSTFDSDPPVGFCAFVFDATPNVLEGTASLPAVPLSGPKQTTLDKLGRQPKLLLAFVDDPMPEGLIASLGRLKDKTPVVVIALKGSEVNVGKLPRYLTNDAGFDKAGIRATPQFYFVSQGKVVQAWSGFRNSMAAKFEADVLSYVPKR